LCRKPLRARPPAADRRSRPRTAQALSRRAHVLHRRGIAAGIHVRSQGLLPRLAMTASEAPSIVGATSDERDQFIPVRKTDILDALIEHGELASEHEREKFRQVCRLLAAIYHYEYFDRLERLRDAYYYFNPDLDPPTHLDRAALERHYEELSEAFLSVLKGANFVEVPHAEIEQAQGERSILQVKLRVPLEDFREVRFFHRGHHSETFTTSK